MGQPIEIEIIEMGDVVVFDTDRTISGQDGESYGSLAEAQSASTLPGQLATALMEADQSLANVFVLSNTVSIRRDGGWTPEYTAKASGIVRNFFVFYEENREELPSS